MSLCVWIVYKECLPFLYFSLGFFCTLTCQGCTSVFELFQTCNEKPKCNCFLGHMVPQVLRAVPYVRTYWCIPDSLISIIVCTPHKYRLYIFVNCKCAVETGDCGGTLHSQTSSDELADLDSGVGRGQWMIKQPFVQHMHAPDRPHAYAWLPPVLCLCALLFSGASESVYLKPEALQPSWLG